MAGLGVPHEGIAVLLNIDLKTLRKHFAVDLVRGSVEATAKVAPEAAGPQAAAAGNRT